MTLELKRLEKEILTVDYNPILDKYYIPSKSRKAAIAKWEVFESRREDGKWYCNCESYCIGLKYEGECRHIKIAKFYKKHEWNKKYIMIRNED
jgi:hypothetical protein